MAKKVTKNNMFGKNYDRVRKATLEHRGDETNFGAGGDLPAGIEGGVAQLVDCKFDVYKKGDNSGEPFFYAAGIVKFPKVHDGTRVEGLRTSIMEPICDTPNRSRSGVEEHVEWVMNEMRKLGVDTNEIDVDDLDAVCESLREEKPHFKFRTWRGDPTPQFPNPRVNEQWKGACDYVEDDEDEDVLDETDEHEEEPEEEVDEEEPDEEEAEEAASDELDGDAADAGDDNAITAIAEAAEAADIDPDEYETWSEVVDAINASGGDEEPEEEETEEEEEPEEEADEWEPDKGEVYLYKPPKSRKPVECEVTAVFKAKRLANIKTLDDNKLYKSVSWDALSQE